MQKRTNRGPRESAEVGHAVTLVQSGMSVKDAAKACGVWFTSVYGALRRRRNQTLEELKDILK